VPTFRQASPTFFQEGADLGQAAADAGQALDGLLGLAGAARRVLDKVVLQGGLVLVQRAGLALPVEVAHSVESALLEFVEVALHGARRDVGQFGDVGRGQAPALQPQHLHLALDARVRVMIAVVAHLRQDVGAEGERAHGYRSGTGLWASSHAVATRLSYGNSASLSGARYKFHFCRCFIVRREGVDAVRRAVMEESGSRKAGGLTVLSATFSQLVLID
jgi:hypothetical protein